MKKLIFFLAIFMFVSAGDLRADSFETVTEGDCTYTTTTFKDGDSIYEIIIDAASNNSAVDTPTACASRPTGKITFKAKEGATFH